MVGAFGLSSILFVVVLLIAIFFSTIGIILTVVGIKMAKDLNKWGMFVAFIGSAFFGLVGALVIYYTVKESEKSRSLLYKKISADIQEVSREAQEPKDNSYVNSSNFDDSYSNDESYNNNNKDTSPNNFDNPSDDVRHNSPTSIKMDDEENESWITNKTENDKPENFEMDQETIQNLNILWQKISKENYDDAFNILTSIDIDKLNAEARNGFSDLLNKKLNIALNMNDQENEFKIKKLINLISF